MFDTDGDDKNPGFRKKNLVDPSGYLRNIDIDNDRVGFVIIIRKILLARN